MTTQGPVASSGPVSGYGGRTMCAPTQGLKASRGGGFQPPEKPSPLRGEGGAAHAATDEGSSFLRPRSSYRICQEVSAPLWRQGILPAVKILDREKGKVLTKLV